MVAILKQAAVAFLAMGASLAMAADVKLQGAGATFPNPLYQRLVTEYQKLHPEVKIDYQSIGSGGGIKNITEKTVDFAGSDAPLNAKQIEAMGGSEKVVEVPSCAGAVVPAYNLPGIGGDLKFTGAILADIFMGKIANWNDPKLAAINPGVQLPNLAITPAWRTDGSGTSFVFSSYLATQSDEFSQTVGAAAQVKWPTGQGGKGSEGVTAVITATPGAIGYVEEIYADANKVPYGVVQNKAGKFVKASGETVSAAGAGAVEKMNGSILAVNIWDQAGENAYPISAFTYLIVYRDLNNIKSKEQAAALVNFLWWATHDGQKIAPELNFAALADGVQKKAEGALKSISYGGSAVLASN